MEPEPARRGLAGFFAPAPRTERPRPARGGSLRHEVRRRPRVVWETPHQRQSKVALKHVIVATTLRPSAVLSDARSDKVYLLGRGEWDGFARFRTTWMLMLLCPYCLKSTGTRRRVVRRCANSRMLAAPAHESVLHFGLRSPRRSMRDNSWRISQNRPISGRFRPLHNS